MKIQPKPTPTPAPTPALPAVKHPTIAGMPDRTSPEWGKAKPQPTVKTYLGEVAPIPKHPAQLSDRELHQRYFTPGYDFDIRTRESPVPFFKEPGRFRESPTRETPAPRSFPAAQPAPGLWGGAAPAPIAQRPKPDPSAEEAPLLPHERPPESASPPQADRFAGFEGGGDAYHGSDWD